MWYGGSNGLRKIEVRTAMTNQQWRVNQHELACFGLPSLLSFLSRSDILLYALVQCSLESLCRDPTCHEEFRHLCLPSCTTHLHLELRLFTGRCTRHRNFWGPGDTPSTPFPFPSSKLCRKPHEQDPLLTQCRDDALTSILYEGVDVENQVVSLFTLSPSDCHGLSSAQRIIVAQPYSIVARTTAFSIRILNSRGVLGRSYTSRVYFHKLYQALRTRWSTPIDKSAS